MRLNDTEAPVLKGAAQLMVLKGFRPFRVQSGKVRTQGKTKDYFVTLAPTGTPDLCGCVPGSGRRLMVECKRPKGGRHSPAQKQFAEVEIAAGAVCLLISDLSLLDAALDRLLDDPFVKLDLQGQVVTDEEAGACNKTPSTSSP